MTSPAIIVDENATLTNTSSLAEKSGHLEASVLNDKAGHPVATAQVKQKYTLGTLPSLGADFDYMTIPHVRLPTSDSTFAPVQGFLVQGYECARRTPNRRLPNCAP